MGKGVLMLQQLLKSNPYYVSLIKGLNTQIDGKN